MKKPTSSDVAKLAGVSQTAVSLILNENEKISFSQETKERVFEAARQLGYTLPARKKKEKTNARVILVFTPTLANAYYTELVTYVEEYVGPMGYYVQVCNTFRNPELEQYFLETQVTSQVVGIIYSFLPSFPKTVDQIMQDIPVAVIGEKQEGMNICSVGLNNLNAGAMMAEHLYQLGHRRIAFLTTPLDRFTLARSQRMEGIRHQMEQNGIRDGFEIIVSDRREQDYDFQGDMPYEYAVGRQLTARFLKNNKGATALIGVNDMTALGIMAELTEVGYRVPQDFSVCGFDNIFMSTIAKPGLTTIEHYLRARCHMAADMLINRNPAIRGAQGINDVRLLNKIEYIPLLVVRDSTGAPNVKE